jgi:hypothetical protein
VLARGFVSPACHKSVVTLVTCQHSMRTAALSAPALRASTQTWHRHASRSHRPGSAIASTNRRRSHNQRKISTCLCSNTPAKSAITSSRRWCAEARHRSARPATAPSCSDVCQCLPHTPTATRAARRRLRWVPADRAAIRADLDPARLTSRVRVAG